MLRFLTLFSLTAWLAPGQMTDADRRAKLPREIRDLIDQSAAAPPELAADILLRLVEAGKILDKKIKAEVLEQAFVLAGSARFPRPLKAAAGGNPSTDSDVGVRYMALEKGLDGLSLQCRVIRTMLEIDRKRALELFQSLPLVRIPSRSCSDAMVEDVEPFYDTLVLLVGHCFNETEKLEGKHLELAETSLRSMSAPAQIEPAAKMISNLELDKKQLGPVLGAYSVALHEMSSDPRAFGVWTHSGLVNSLRKLAQDSEATGVSSFGLLDAFRAYYVRGMRSTRCEDDREIGLERLAESFNSDLRTIADPEGKQILPIQGDELQPTKVEGHATAYEFWSKPETQKLLKDLKHLRSERRSSRQRTTRKSAGLMAWPNS